MSYKTSIIRWKVNARSDTNNNSVTMGADMRVEDGTYPITLDSIRHPPEALKVEFIKNCLNDLYEGSREEIVKFLQEDFWAHRDGD